MSNEKIDITKYPEGPQEIMKYIDWVETDEEKQAALATFVFLCFQL